MDVKFTITEQVESPFNFSDPVYEYYGTLDHLYVTLFITISRVFGNKSDIIEALKNDGVIEKVGEYKTLPNHVYKIKLIKGSNNEH